MTWRPVARMAPFLRQLAQVPRSAPSMMTAAWSSARFARQSGSLGVPPTSWQQSTINRAIPSGGAGAPPQARSRGSNARRRNLTAAVYPVFVDLDVVVDLVIDVVAVVVVCLDAYMHTTATPSASTTTSTTTTTTT